MKVVITKQIEEVFEIPDDHVEKFFGEAEYFDELNFMQWATDNTFVEPTGYNFPEDKVEAFVNFENVEKIEVEDIPEKLKDKLKPKYSKKWIDYLTQVRENSERCYECTGYDDSYDLETGESLCDSCPCFEPIDPPDEGD